MAAALDTQRARPFGLETRKRLISINQNKHMDILTTFLTLIKIHKYDDLLKNLTYKQLHTITDDFWESFEESFEEPTDDRQVTPTQGGSQFSAFDFRCHALHKIYNKKV